MRTDSRSSRRSFLRAAGVTVAMPWVAPRAARALRPDAPIRRLVCVGLPYAMIPEYFFPKEEGPDCVFPRSLEPLESHRKHLTVFSNLDHAQAGGHWVVHTFLSGVRSSEANGMPDGNMTLDQRAAEHIGPGTRLPSLNLSVGPGCEMCWTRDGVQVPPIQDPRTAFGAMFIDGSPAERARIRHRLQQDASILDCLNGQAQREARRLGRWDREKLDEYFSAIREVERTIGMTEHWSRTDKPKVQPMPLERRGFIENIRLSYDLMLLALQTDSTRVATLEYSPSFDTGQLGLKFSYHPLSHFTNDPDKPAELAVIEKVQVREHARFLTRLSETIDVDGRPLLDSTVVLFGSGLGNGDNHSNRNLPILLAGGGLKHVVHRRLPEEAERRVPLSNLYLALLQDFGVELDSFHHSTGSLSGLT